jgi:ferredoxin-type protein NapF
MQLARRRFLGLGSSAPESVARIAAIGEDCLALRGVACDLCRDSCEVSAIRFQPRLGAPAEPHIADDCTGCGDCVAVCPSQALSLTPREYSQESTHE